MLPIDLSDSDSPQNVDMSTLASSGNDDPIEDLDLGKKKIVFLSCSFFLRPIPTIPPLFFQSFSSINHNINFPRAPPLV